MPYLTESHPVFVDYALRTSGRSSETIIQIHEENFAAPFLVGLDGKNALASYPDITKTKNKIERDFPGHDDARSALEIIQPWSQNRPDGIWVVSGAERIRFEEGFIWEPKEPRFSAISLAVDPATVREPSFFRKIALWLSGTWHHVTGTFDERDAARAYFYASPSFIGEAERMDDIDGASLDPVSDRLDVAIDTASFGDWKAAMKQPRSNPDDKSSSSSGGSSKKKGTWKAPNAPLVGENWRPPDPSKRKAKTAVVSVRVTEEAKAAIDAQPVLKRELLQAVGLALDSGANYAEVVAKMQAVAAALCHDAGTPESDNGDTETPP